MPRPPRVEFPDALYHVSVRGMQKAAIVLDDRDRVRWMEYLKEAVRRFRLELHAFALMDNHFHLFVATPQANLGKAMQYLNGAHAMYFNVRHGRTGHLFERRYHAVLVEDEGHYTEVSRYVHLNPVRAGICKRPEDYAWSSYHGYHSGRKPFPWLNYDRVLEEFGEGKDARMRYREFVADAIGLKAAPPWADAVGGWLFGSRRFAARVYAVLASTRSEERWGARAAFNADYAAATLDQIASTVRDTCNVNQAVLTEGGPGSRAARDAFIIVARDLAGMPLESIAAYLGLSCGSAVCQAARRARKRLAEKKELRTTLSRIESRLKTVI